MQNIGVLSYFNNRVANLVIKRFFENNIKIKNVILVGTREKDSVRKNWYNYMNSNVGIELCDLEKHNINFHFVKKINSIVTKNLIKKLKIDILLNFSGIIKNQLLQLSNTKIINGHPGILPFYRGSMCPEWTVINKEKIVGATCHIVTKNVDEGPIIYQQKLKYPYPRNYHDFRSKIFNLEAKVLIKGVKLLRKKKKLIIQRTKDGNYYKPMSKKLILRVKKILRNREFQN